METTIKSMRVGFLSDEGELRDHNEDALLVIRQLDNPLLIQPEATPFGLSPLGCLLVVADGMGGAAAGEVAAQQATQSIHDYFTQTTFPDLLNPDPFYHLERAIYYTQVQLINIVRQNSQYRGMGTTLVVAWVHGTKGYIGWVGDSRCYHATTSGKFTLLTNDHSLVWQQVMAGKLTLEQAAQHEHRNIITQNLGAESHPPLPDFTTVTLQPGDRLLLCSDGLNTMLTHEQIHAVLRTNPLPQAASEALVRAANEAGGEDNITVIVLEIIGSESRSRDTADVVLKPGKASSTKTGVWSLLKNIRL
jgi:serine/threonine protein phosphatase PrpC